VSRRALTSIVAALLLALVPATAFADGAGDQQYQDPLTAPATPKKVKKQAAATPVTTAPATTSAPAATTAPASSSSTPPTASASQGQLPRTGFPAGLLGLGGAALVASGAALRRRTAAQ
jgi:hypothetical protein